MKAIIENVLREYIEEVGPGAVVYAESLVNLLQEINTLTVSKLRPMCDAPKFDELNRYCVQVLAWHKFEECFISGIVFTDWKFRGSYENYKLDEFDGWIPIPIYKPELTGDGEKTAG